MKVINYRSVGRLAYYICTNLSQYGNNATGKDWRRAISDILDATDNASTTNIDKCLLANNTNRLYSSDLLYNPKHNTVGQT
jgi:hypothetical protein